MTSAWIVVGVLFVGTASMRAAGPVAFGGRSLSGRGAAVVGLVAPAILGALVVYEPAAAASSSMRACSASPQRRSRSCCACR
jgi:hypothetical protein